MGRRVLSTVLGVGLLLLSVALAARGARPVGAAALPGVGVPELSAGLLPYLMIGVAVGAGGCALAVVVRMGALRKRRVE